MPASNAPSATASSPAKTSGYHLPHPPPPPPPNPPPPQIQTKYTPHDEPYASSPTTPTITSQVLASVADSLRNLFPEPQSEEPYLDALILHSPFPHPHQTLEAYAALLPLVPAPLRALGISNVTLPTLRLLSTSPIPPSIVQNRLRAAERAWDVDVRRWCRASGARYQGFWTLTGNEEWKTDGGVGEVARGAGVERAVAWYVLLGEVGGVVVLNGTTRGERMRGDVEGWGRVGEWSRGTEEGRGAWERAVEGVRGLIGV